MPANVFNGGPCAYRYTDYPMPGSIYSAPDDLRLQRGPTLVRLPGGKEVRVPATERREVAAASQMHDMNSAQAKMAMMMAMLSGRPAQPQAPAGWKHGPAGRPDAGRHPLREPRPAPGVGNHLFHF